MISKRNRHGVKVYTVDPECVRNSSGMRQECVSDEGGICLCCRPIDICRHLRAAAKANGIEVPPHEGGRVFYYLGGGYQFFTRYRFRTGFMNTVHVLYLATRHAELTICAGAHHRHRCL